MILIGIDPGETCGVVQLSDGQITHADNYTQEQAIEYIFCVAAANKITVVYEDMQLFRGLPIGQHIVDTAKFLGQFEYRMKQSHIDIVPVVRWKIKEWVHNNCAEIVIPRIIKKITKLDLRKKNGEPVQPKFAYVDDRSVEAAMREYWNIQKPKPGHRNKYGISRHAWQALALVTYYINTKT